MNGCSNKAHPSGASERALEKGTDIASTAVKVISHLKHHWLQNLLLNWTADEVVLAWHHTGWPALKSESLMRLEELKALSRTLEHELSPARLVGLLYPFSQLSGSARERLETALHEAYLRKPLVAQLKRDLDGAAKGLEKSLRRFFVIWETNPAPQTEKDLREGWLQVSRAAELLLRVLQSVPTGPLLP